MKTNEQKVRPVKKENSVSKYAGKPLNSTKEEAAKKFEGTAMNILKQFQSSK